MSPFDMLTSSVDAASKGIGVTFTLEQGMMPPGFPRGELLNEMIRDGKIERTYRFNPIKVIGWMMKMGLVVMEREDKTLRFRVIEGEPA